MAIADQQTFLSGGVSENGDMTLSLLCILALIIINWDIITAVATWVARKVSLVFGVVVCVAGWLSKQLSNVQSIAESASKLWEARNFTRITMGTSHPGRFLSAAMRWYFPFDRPALTVVRLSITLIGYMALDAFLLAPMQVHAFMLPHEVEEVLSDSKSYEYYFQEDIHHLPALTLITPLIIIIAISPLFVETVFNNLASSIPSKPSTTTETKGKGPQETNTTTPTITSQPDPHLQKILQYIEGSVQRDRAGLDTGNKRIQELEAKLEEEKASRIAAQEDRTRAFVQKENLRDQLVVRTTQLQKAQMEHRNAMTEHESEIRQRDRQVAILKEHYEEKLQNNAQTENDQRDKQVALLKEHYEKKLQYNAETANDLESEIAKLNEKLKKAISEKTLVDQTAQLQKSEARVSETTAEIKNLKADLKQKSEAIEQLQHTLEEQTKAAELYLTNVTELESELVEQLEQKTHVEQDLRCEISRISEESHARIEAIRSELDSKASERESQLLTDLAQKTQVEQELVNEIHRLDQDSQSQVERVRSDLYLEYNTAVELLRLSSCEKDMVIQNLTNAIDIANSRIDNLDLSLQLVDNDTTDESAAQTISELEQKVIRLEGDIYSTQDEVKELKGQIKEKDENFKLAQFNIDALEIELACARAAMCDHGAGNNMATQTSNEDILADQPFLSMVLPINAQQVLQDQRTAYESTVHQLRRDADARVKEVQELNEHIQVLECRLKYMEAMEERKDTGPECVSEEE